MSKIRLLSYAAGLLAKWLSLSIEQPLMAPGKFSDIASEYKQQEKTGTTSPPTQTSSRPSMFQAGFGKFLSLITLAGMERMELPAKTNQLQSHLAPVN